MCFTEACLLLHADETALFARCFLSSIQCQPLFSSTTCQTRFFNQLCNSTLQFSDLFLWSKITTKTLKVKWHYNIIHLRFTTTAKQILDCTISYIKVQHPCANLKKEILQNVLCLKKIYSKQIMKNSYNQKTIFSKKKYTHINMWPETHHYHYLRKTQWMSKLTRLRKSVIREQAYNYYKSVWHNSLEIKAVKRWLLSCSYMI